MIFKKIIATLLLASQFAWAGLPPTTLQGQNDAGPTTTFSFQVPNSQATRLGGPKALIETGNLNQLPNPGFNGIFTAGAPANWTTTSGTPSQDTTNYLDGKTSVLVTASAQQSLIAQDFTPTVQWGSVNLEYSCWVKTAMTTVQVCARNGGATIGTCASVPGTGKWQYVAVNYPGPSSGSVGVSVGLSASGTGAYNVDTCYVGPARNLSQVSQAQLYARETVTSGGPDWTTTATYPAYGDFAATGTAVFSATGNCTAPVTSVPQVVCNNAPPGTYVMIARSYFWRGSDNNSVFFRFSDGTINGDDNVDYLNVAASAIAFPSISGSFTYTTAGNRTFKIQGSSGNGVASDIHADRAGFAWDILYYPSQSQIAVNSNVGPVSMTSNGTPTGGASAGAIIIFPTVQFDSNGAYNASTGRYTIPVSGYYQVSANGNFTNPAHVFVYINAVQNVLLADGQNNLLTGSVNVKVNAGDIIDIRSDANVGAIGTSSSYSITLQNGTMNAPITVGSVTSQSAGAEHIERARIPSGCASITSQSGNWITSVSKPAAGQCIINFAAGEFSSAPSCVVTAGDAIIAGNAVGSSTSSVEWNMRAIATSVLTDSPVEVICMGPR